MNIKDKAAKIRTLSNDDTYQEVIKEIRNAQVSVFLNGQSQLEAINDAHDIIRALDKIEDYFNTVFADEAIFDKKERGTAPWKRLIPK
ncbi:hypothetical protein N9H96_02830 [Porticoccaceae bacterium]|nr:hypothetical protein [Porticoccaceae bacterium]MDB4484282.1 hypothetical protein [bacterium]MDG1166169.1 hypothetical protein [Porticoccaceae bacterium]